jgi:hypothetical protein
MHHDGIWGREGRVVVASGSRALTVDGCSHEVDMSKKSGPSILEKTIVQYCFAERE